MEIEGKGFWTEEEDERLREAKETLRLRSWRDIAQHVGSRSSGQCCQRWNRVIRPGLRKDPWSESDLNRLREVVSSVGEHNWKRVSEYFPGRTDLSCRTQYFRLRGLEENASLTEFDTESPVPLLQSSNSSNSSSVPNMGLNQPFVPMKDANSPYSLLNFHPILFPQTRDSAHSTSAFSLPSVLPLDHRPSFSLSTSADQGSYPNLPSSDAFRSNQLNVPTTSKNFDMASVFARWSPYVNSSSNSSPYSNLYLASAAAAAAAARSESVVPSSLSSTLSIPTSSCSSAPRTPQLPGSKSQSLLPNVFAADPFVRSREEEDTHVLLQSSSKDLHEKAVSEVSRKRSVLERAVESDQDILLNVDVQESPNEPSVKVRKLNPVSDSKPERLNMRAPLLPSISELTKLIPFTPLGEHRHPMYNMSTMKPPLVTDFEDMDQDSEDGKSALSDDWHKESCYSGSGVHRKENLLDRGCSFSDAVHSLLSASNLMEST